MAVICFLWFSVLFSSSPSWLFSFWQVVVTQLQQMKVNMLVKEITDIGAFGILVLTMTTK